MKSNSLLSHQNQFNAFDFDWEREVWVCFACAGLRPIAAFIHWFSQIQINSLRLGIPLPVNKSFHSLFPPFGSIPQLLFHCAAEVHSINKLISLPSLLSFQRIAPFIMNCWLVCLFWFVFLFAERHGRQAHNPPQRKQNQTNLHQPGSLRSFLLSAAQIKMIFIWIAEREWLALPALLHCSFAHSLLNTQRAAIGRIKSNQTIFPIRKRKMRLICVDDGRLL